jgi:cytochrome b561
MMKWQNSIERYGLFSMLLHWLVLILFVAVYASIELREFFPKGSEPREAMKAWHFMLGLCVMTIMIPRLWFMFQGRFPVIQPEPPHWQKKPARWMHLTLYGLMVLMPLSGWLLLSAEAKPIPLFGLQLPALVGESKTVADLMDEFHEIVGRLGYLLIGLHSCAALIHHYVLRDNALKRMLPNGCDTQTELQK